MMKKKILLALSFVLVAVLSVGVTLALLTSTAFDKNTMTIGQAEIEQLEYQRKVDANGNWITSSFTGYGYTADEMEEFKQDELLLPTTSKSMSWDMRNGSQAASGEGSHQQPWSQIGAPGSNQLFDKSNTNVKDKFVFVQNTGSVDVYYRTIIAIEAPLNQEVISDNINANERFVWEYTELDTMSEAEKEAVEQVYVTINGTRYKLIVATHQEALTKDEISRPSLLQVYMNYEADNEDVQAYGNKVDILVFSQAVQAKGFANATTALNDAFGKITTNNHPWK